MKTLLLTLLLIPLLASAVVITNNSDVKIQPFVKFQIKGSANNSPSFCQHRPSILPRSKLNINLANFCGLNTLNNVRVTQVFMVTDATDLVANCKMKNGFNNNSIVVVNGAHGGKVKCSVETGR